MPTTDQQAFRRALGNFATGVTIITACTADGNKAGITASSFNSVSLDPPLILWSIGKKSSSFAIFDQASHFAINILSSSQTQLAHHFAKRNIDKFSDIELEVGINNSPLLPNCSARFQCQKQQIIDAGDHWLIIGKVVQYNDFGEPPLIFHQGAFAGILSSNLLTKLNNQQPTTQTSQAHDSVYYLLSQALKKYQQNYLPQQLQSGLRTSDARMLMILDARNQLSMAQLLQDINIPIQQMQQTSDFLLAKGWAELDGDNYRLTAQGKQQAQSLHTIAKKQEQQAFSQHTEQEIEIFKSILREMIKV